MPPDHRHRMSHRFPRLDVIGHSPKRAGLVSVQFAIIGLQFFVVADEGATDPAITFVDLLAHSSASSTAATRLHPAAKRTGDASSRSNSAPAVPTGGASPAPCQRPASSINDTGLWRLRFTRKSKMANPL